MDSRDSLLERKVSIPLHRTTGVVELRAHANYEPNIKGGMYDLLGTLELDWWLPGSILHPVVKG
jgi:hypothetical protein